MGRKRIHYLNIGSHHFPLSKEFYFFYTIAQHPTRRIGRADIEIMDSFSAHADRKEIVEFLENQKSRVKKIFLVHGELDRQQSLVSYLKENGFEQEIVIPKLAQEFDLT